MPYRFHSSQNAEKTTVEKVGVYDVQRCKIPKIIVYMSILSNRVHLLNIVLSAIGHSFGRDARTHIWIDYDVNWPNLHRVVETARRYTSASPEHRRVVTFQRHLGTRATWLSALSMAIQRLLIVLEDDVVLRPDVRQW